MIPAFLFLSIPLLISILSVAAWETSTVTVKRGHYPVQQCFITNVLLDWQTRTFQYKSSTDLVSKECYSTNLIWDVEPKTNLNVTKCDVIFDEGFVFPVYASYGGNYFHLHYDTLIPLYSEVYHKKPLKRNIAFMPSIERARLQAIAGDHALLPLDTRLLQQEQNICFREISFGTQRVSFSDEELIKGFANYMHTFSQTDLKSRVPPRVGIIRRSNRRRILNENELVTALRRRVETDLLRFEGLSVKEQLQLVQNYSVLAGINGAGLMNCLYLPPSSVCIQMVPYQAQLNWKQFGELLLSRGPYLEWHNTHENLTKPSFNDHYNNRPDTIVHIEEFSAVIDKALASAADQRTSIHEEL